MKRANQRHQPYLVFMLALSVIALGALAFEAVFHVSAGTRAILAYVDVVICTLFFLDFLVLLYRAENRWRYLATWGWLDLISSVPAVSALRVARVARVVRILRVLRGVRAARILTRFLLERRANGAILAAVLVTIILVAVAAIALLHFEVPAGGNIETPEDAVWWAVSTVTGVGYGDKFPVTSEGRLTAAVLMFAGFGLIAVLSGSVAAWFLAPSGERREDQIAELRKEVAELKGLLKSYSAEAGR